MKYIVSLSLILLIFSNADSQTVDTQGKKQGYWKKVDEKSNKLIYEGMFKDDKPVGVFKYYYPFDTVKAIIDFKADGRSSYAKLFHPNGKLMAKGKYIGESIKDSVWIYYDDAGVMLSKDNYALGKKNGTSYVYFPNGKVSEERNYKQDVQHGTFKQYFDGTKVKGEGTYVEGKLDGKNAYYYPNGVAAAFGYYKNGNKTGPWIYKNTEGKITEKELYLENGQLANPKKTEEFFNKNKPKEDKPKEGAKKDTKTAGKKS
jgi:antitoxin component YwqK of YwqJK toxin-antitoxin module